MISELFPLESTFDNPFSLFWCLLDMSSNKKFTLIQAPIEKENEIFFETNIMALGVESL